MRSYVQSEIERHARRIKATSPLVVAARAGTLEVENVASYLASLKFLLGSMPSLLARARDRAREQGNEDLADFFDEKVREETGHDQWAEEDFAVLQGVHGVERPVPMPALVAFVEELGRATDADPRSLLAYVVWAEYVTVLVGGELVESLVERIGIPRGALTCLARHVELDQDHAEEGLDLVESLEDGLPEVEELDRLFELFFVGYERWSSECAGATGRAGRLSA